MKITARDALIVVDIQNDFCPKGALAVPDGDAIITTVNALMQRFDCVVLTQDWHPATHISFAAHHDKAPFSSIELPYGEQVLWPTHCVQGSVGADFHAQLDTTTAQLIIRKGCTETVDSYSAFLEADKKSSTGLAGYLRERGVERVFVVGLATDFCVAWTAIDARTLGFDCVVIEDACRAIDNNGSLQAAWQAMDSQGVIRAHSQQLTNI